MASQWVSHCALGKPYAYVHALFLIPVNVVIHYVNMRYNASVSQHVHNYEYRTEKGHPKVGTFPRTTKAV